MTLGQNFPVSEYYKENIIDAKTIRRGGSWWTAVLLIKDPKTDRPFLSIYRWQYHSNKWKVRKSISFKSKELVEDVIESLISFKNKL